jgi:nicotinate-nucleotide adenylyltransferase
MSNEKRIALYGGTFDPVHVGHVTLASRLLELFALDGVIFIPAHVAPHKRERVVTRAVHRYAMLALATQGEWRFRISTVEIDAPESPYTVDTLRHFIEKFGRSTRLFFVMGADSWLEISTWRDWERVLTLTDTIVVTRPGYELNVSHVTPLVRERIVDLRAAEHDAVEKIPSQTSSSTPRIFFSDVVEIDVSATEIRRAVLEEQGEKNALDEERITRLEELVSPSVAEYIRKYRLYQERS